MSVKRIASLLALAGCLVTAGVQACGVNWTVPENHFDGVNEQGYVAYWEQIGSIDLGDNLRIPLIIGFHSDQNWSSPYLGKGWMLPLLDSNIVQTSENTFLQIQPDGHNVCFGRDGKNKKLLRGQAGWTGQIDEDIITLYASCGWKLTYKRGKLASISTPNGRTLNLVTISGKIAEVRDQGKTILEVKTDPKTGLVNGLVYGQERIGIELGDKPEIETIEGKSVINRMERSLAKLMLPDKSERTYRFAVNEQIQPRLKVLNAANAESRVFTWNAIDKRIISENGWKYLISFPVKGENAKINRVNSQGQTEMWFYDGASGCETTEDLNGTKIERRWFLSGPAIGKERKITAFDKFGTMLSEERLIYDQMGARIRSIKNGVQKIYKNNNLVRIISENKVTAFEGLNEGLSLNIKDINEDIYKANKKLMISKNKDGIAIHSESKSGLKFQRESSGKCSIQLTSKQ
jgi:hypothetical protein